MLGWFGFYSWLRPCAVKAVLCPASNLTGYPDCFALLRQVTLYQPKATGVPGAEAATAAAAEAEGAEDAEEREERLGRLSFVDLAGSERAQRTGNVGVRLK